MDIDQLKNLLHRYGLKPNFTYGQNFLVDDAVLDDMVEAAHVTKADAVLEIGPGIGNLTRLLCERAGFVLSVEKDPKFLPILKAIKKDHKNFQWEIADVLEFDFQNVFERRESTDDHANIANSRHSRVVGTLAPPTYKVVANIPYFITGKILQMLLTAEYPPTSITVLMQKEVAHNAVASPGNMSILSISVQLYGKARIVRTVPKHSFHPAPKVDSAVLHIELYKKSPYKIDDEKKFFGLVKGCFSGKRKQVHNTLANTLKITKAEARRLLEKCSINPDARPQELTLEQWIALYNDTI